MRLSNYETRIKNVIATALVDDEIWHEATRHKSGTLETDQYVASDMTDLGRIRLHNFSLWRKLKGEIEKGMLVDHIICGKDNRRNCKLANLRINTPSGNSHNRCGMIGKKGVQQTKKREEISSLCKSKWQKDLYRNFRYRGDGSKSGRS